MPHAQDVKDVLLGEDIKALAGDGLNDSLQRDIIDATVLKICCWLEVAFAMRDIIYQSVAVRRAVFFLNLVDVRVWWQS